MRNGMMKIGMKWRENTGKLKQTKVAHKRRRGFEPRRR